MSSTPNLAPITKIEKKNLMELLVNGKRIDGRGLTDYRPFTIEKNVIEKANGSAQIKLGKTKVMVGIKVETGEPFSDTPDEGVLMVNAELVPLASPTFEPGPPDENAIELARVVDRGLRESKALDLKKLCIKEGEKVFIVFVDIYVLDYDGNLIDASAIAALTALLTAKIRNYEVKNGELIYKDDFIPLPIQNYPIPVTFAKINNTLLVDPSIEEERIMDARLTLTIDKNNQLCAIQKGGLKELTLNEIDKAINIAIEKSSEIRNKILEASNWGEQKR
ncbi:MAG: exosome complex protein Rrp42 [Candidatus Bathyarchaeia archaeon]|nr:exosome complex protein Rrp42 [Candidatus Bathyarchaeota archaeon]